MGTPTPPEPTRDDLVASVLGELPVLRVSDVASITGVGVGEVTRLWRALGFPEPGDEVAFTPSDLDAVSLIFTSVDDETVDQDTAINVARAIGQTMSRLAEWETATLMHRLDAIGPVEGEPRIATAMRLVEEFSESFERLITYTWRRHLAAAVSRVEGLGDEGDEVAASVTVGFADLVSFTALSNEMDEERIGDLVELFESRCHDVVTTNHGRIVKSLGDSVLFVCEDAECALDVADGIIRVVGRDPRMPDVHIGLASGHVVLRMGDVFGPPVNMAARLTAVARRNRVIIDDATADRLPADRFETRRLPARPLRGFGLVEPVAVRRT